VTVALKPRDVPTRAVPRLPPNFARNFVEGGWRQLERVYGCRDDVLLKWFEMAGGLVSLQQRRRDWLREQSAVAQAKAAAQRGAS
jgi:hypothetical protein